jgi:hypothetical protein
MWLSSKGEKDGGRTGGGRRDRKEEDDLSAGKRERWNRFFALLCLLSLSLDGKRGNESSVTHSIYVVKGRRGWSTHVLKDRRREEGRMSKEWREKTKCSRLVMDAYMCQEKRRKKYEREGEREQNRREKKKVGAPGRCAVDQRWVCILGYGFDRGKSHQKE